MTGAIKTASDFLPIYSSDGRLGLTNAACMISIPDKNAFVITGGIKTHSNTGFPRYWRGLCF